MDTNKAAEKPDPNDDYGPPSDDLDLEEIAPATPPEKPAPKPKATPPSMPLNLRNAARSLGISDDEINNATPDELREAISYIIVLDRERTRAQQKPAEKQLVEDDDEAEIESLDKELSLDPRLKKLLKKGVATSKEAKELKAALAAQTKREKDRLVRAGTDAVNMGFDSLPEEFKTIFGDGDHTTLDKASKEWKRRVAIFHASGVDLENDSPATITRKIAKTAKEQFEDFVAPKKKAAAKAEPEDDEDDDEVGYQAPARPKAKAKPKREGPDLDLGGNEDLDDWSEAGTARPTNRKVVEKKGTKAAQQAVRRYYQENGVPGGGNDDVFSGMPD